MPSRASTSFLPSKIIMMHAEFEKMCQCPLGLVPHFYASTIQCERLCGYVSMPSRASTSFLHQCDYLIKVLKDAVSMPSRASTSFLQFYGYQDTSYQMSVSMPSRASTSFLQYPFRNLGFMRFPEPLFAGICQNILTTAHFYACS